jgi:hypothetical protein
MSALREAIAHRRWFRRLIAGAAGATVLHNWLNKELAGLRGTSATRTHLGRRAVEPALSAAITCSNPSGLLAAQWAASVHTSRWSDRCEDFAIVGWYLYRQEAAFAAAYRVKGYAHASREYFGVVVGFLLGHEAGSQVHHIPTWQQPKSWRRVRTARYDPFLTRQL